MLFHIPQMESRKQLSAVGITENYDLSKVYFFANEMLLPLNTFS